ncbi:MAG: DUF6089 family protein [Tannerella sp.]|jgi:hypothetical protein|nr:DUF6089 family protein [Tannerella sp.]
MQKVLIILFAAGMTCLNEIKAQEYMYEIGGMAGGAFYMGDVNKNTAFGNMNPSAGFVFRYNRDFRVALKWDVAWARVSGTTAGLANVFPDNAQTQFQRNVFDFGGQVEYNFFPYSDKYKYLYTKKVSPYIAGGLGLSFAPAGASGAFFGPHISAGTGVKYKLAPRWNIGAELSIRKLFGDGLDTTPGNALLDDPYKTGGSAWKNKDWYAMMTIVITYDFGLRDCNCNNKDLKVKKK